MAFVDAVAAGIETAGARVETLGERLDPEGRRRRAIVDAAVAIGVATSTAYDRILASSASFGELSSALRIKMAWAGSHGIWRTYPDAKSLFDVSIPDSIRHLGESATWEFLDGKHASHIKSVFTDPLAAMDPSNIVWESSKSNLSRGRANMTGLELAKANVANLMDAAGIVAMHAIEAAAVAGCVGMALEGVVSLGENLIYVYGGDRTVNEAMVDIAINSAKKGLAAAAGGVVVTLAIALGAGPVLSSMAPILITIGGSVYLVSAVIRIASAVESCKDREAVASILLEAPAAP